MSSEFASSAAQSILARIVLRIAQLCGIDPGIIDIRERFSRYGLDSQGALSLLAELEQALKRSLSPTLIWEQPTPEALAQYLADAQAGEKAEVIADLRNSSTPVDEPIAVIGMACRFPMAASPQAFWRLLCGGVDAITVAPRERWDAEALFDLDLTAPGKMNTRRGGFLAQIEQFDPAFFGISPREASQMDPQQRLMLELSWEALEDAGLVASELRGSRAGVFFGVAWTDYAMLVHRGGLPAMNQHTVTGFHRSIVANRVSYTFGLQGPSIALDTACSSSLVAVHLGCESLRRGESTLALVGGVNLNIVPESTVGVSKFGGLSPDGHCYTFDARANGYVRGEGGGVVVLKPLSRALADGDPVYCVIRGSAVNNDGASNGLTAPNPLAQQAVLRAAYQQAGIDPRTVDYVEAHGTGTLLGDPIEAKALGAVLGAGRPADRSLLVGSVKTNIGHLEAAAGIAGLIKVALSIKHRLLPPSLNFETPNPHIPFSDLSLRIQRTLGTWPDTSAAATAGLSAFGFGGTNCHVVLQDWAAPQTELLPFSAESPAALAVAAQAILIESASALAHTPLPSFCRRAAARSSDHAHRLALSAGSYRELQQGLASYLAGERRPGLAVGHVDSRVRTGPVFVFSGQGSQWACMGRSLLQREPVFRATLERCSQLVQKLLGWSLLDELTAERQRSRLDEIDVSCPAIVSVEIALAMLWRSWGIEPALVVGHSIGEVAAAYVAGVLSLEDAMLVICTQGRLIRRIRGRGTMGLAALSWEDAGRAVAGPPYQGRLSRAIHESPGSTVFSGEAAALHELFSTLQQRGIFCRQVNVDVAAHGPQLDGLRAELLATLRGVTPQRAAIPISSSVTGGLLAGEKFDARHWVENLASPVLFSEAVSSLLPSGATLFLEVSPHPLLKRAVETCAAHSGRSVLYAHSLRRDEDERAALLENLGSLYTLGQPVRWGELYRDGSAGAFGAASLAMPAEEGAHHRVCYTLPLSAHCEAALITLARDHLDRLLPVPAEGPPKLGELAYSASVRRSHHKHRLAVVASDHSELQDALTAFAAGRPHPAWVQGRVGLGQRPKVVFVFPGQGSQWVGMGRELLEDEEIFRSAIAACDRVIRRQAGFSVAEVLQGVEGCASLDSVEVVQPVLFAIAVALAAQWRHWGVEPDAVVGHSLGEVAAAHVAGLLSLDDAARVICHRSRLLRGVCGQGAMALVELTVEEAARELSGFEDRVAVAVSNGPRSTVLSGEPAALGEVLARIERKGLFCRRVNVDVASHSPQMDPLLCELREGLRELAPTPAKVPMYSTVLARQLAGAEVGAEYWAQNLRAPVLFSNVVEQLLASDHHLFVEMSPHPVLLPAITDALRHGRHAGAALPSLRRGQPARRVLLESLAALYTSGCTVEWTRLYPLGGRRVPLPPYPWQRQRCWVDPVVESPQPLPPGRSQRGGRAVHPLLSAHLTSSLHPGVHFWEQELSAAELPYLTEHCLQGEIVLPGAAYVEMALAAAEVFAAGTVTLSQVAFQRMLIISASAPQTVQVVVTKSGSAPAPFQIASRVDDTWVVHALGTMHWEQAHSAATFPLDALQQIQKRCKKWMSGSELYQRLSAEGLVLGASFKGVAQLWMSEDEVLGQIRPPDEVSKQALAYLLHPAVLDACFQVMAGLIGVTTAGSGEEGYVLTSVESLRFHRQPRREAWVHGKRRARADHDARDLVGDITLFNEDGSLSVEVQGLHIRRLAPQSYRPQETYTDWLYAVEWSQTEPRALKQETRSTPTRGTWLLLSDRSGTGSRLSALLCERGYRCIQALAGDRYAPLGPDLYQLDPRDAGSFQRLLREAFAADQPGGVAHLWSLDGAAPEDTTVETLERDQGRGTVSALYLAQALLLQGWRDVPPLSLVTRGAHAVGAPRAAVNLSQAPLWGLGRTLALEHPELRCVRIDLSPVASAREDLALLGELLSRDGESDVALREEGRHVARLRRMPGPAKAAGAIESARATQDPVGTAPGSAPPAVRADGAYLITGGRHPLGLAAAEWLVAQGARQVVLVDREGTPDTGSPAIAAMRQAGVHLLCMQADVGQRSGALRALAAVDSRALQLRGILHVEEILDDCSLLALDGERLGRVMAPKAQGAWNLHALTLDRSLDWFILCSSAASLLGYPEQANYAAASAFLDALAQYRRARGLCALSINWGGFRELGTMSPGADTDQRPYRGIEALKPAEGAEILGRLLGHEAPQLGVLKLNLRHWIEFYPAASSSPLLSELRRDSAVAQQRTAEASQLRELLSRTRQEDRQGLLEAHICEQLSLTLHQDVSRISPLVPLRSLGLDSMMAMELRNRLESSLNLKLSSSLLFTYSHVTALAKHALSELGFAASESGPVAEVSEPAEPWTGIEQTIAQMSDDEAESLLLESIRAAE